MTVVNNTNRVLRREIGCSSLQYQKQAPLWMVCFVYIKKVVGHEITRRQTNCRRPKAPLILDKNLRFTML